METISYTTDQIFTGLPPGTYELCGLAYLTTDGPLLPPIDGTDLETVINQQIDDGEICATFAVPEPCFLFYVVPSLDLPITIEGPENVCAGQLVTYTINNPYGDDIEPTVGISMGGFSFFEVVGDQVNVIWLSGPGNICVLATNECGMIEDCIMVNVNNIFYNPTLIGEFNVCNGQEETYTLNPNLPPGYTSSFTANCGDITAQSDNSITVLWNTSGSCQLCYVITDPCGISETTCQSILVNEPAPPVIFMDATACVNGSFTASIEPSPLYTSYNWSATPAIINSGQGTSSITLSSLSTGITTVCIEVTSDCGPPQSSCKTIEITDPPIPDIMVVSQCGLDLMRNGNPNPLTRCHLGVWSQISGPVVLNFAPPGNPTFLIECSCF